MNEQSPEYLRAGSLRSLSIVFTIMVLCSPFGLVTHAQTSEGDQSNTGDMEERLYRLESRIENLQASESDFHLSRRRSEEIRALVSEVLNDADSRTGMQSSNLQAGFDNGFVIRDEDGNFELEVSGRIQFRYTLTQRKNSPVDNSRGGFEPRRVKLSVSGHVVDPRIKYKATVARDRFNPGAVSLETMYVKFQVTDDLTFQIGRFRSPLLREEQVSSKRQLLVERSVVAKTFKQDRTNGLMLRYETDHWRTFLAAMDASPQLYQDENWIYAARGEWLLWGRWKDLKDYTSFPDQDPVMTLGGGLLQQLFQPHIVGQANERLLRWTVDLSAEFGGANFMIAYVSNEVSKFGSKKLNQNGAIVQAGVFLNKDWEIFGRYEWGDADHANPFLSIITVGANRYIDGHRLKATADIGFALNEVGSLWKSTSTGWLQDPSGQSGQILGRMQFQLLF